MNSRWQKAAEILKNGGVVIIPSESVFGIAALISNPAAIKKLYQIKKRADNKPSLIIVGSFEQAQKLVDFSAKGLVLASKYWPASPAKRGEPGGLTMVLDSRVNSLPTEIYGEGDSLAVRLPNDQNLRDLALEVGPFILPSANFNNEKPPFAKEEIDPKLVEMVDYLLDESPGGNQVSILVDVRGDEIKILRQGAVKINE